MSQNHRRTSPFSPRILVVDDMPSIFEDFERVLDLRSHGAESLEAMAAELLGTAPISKQGMEHPEFRLSYSGQGEDAIDEVRDAIRGSDTYSVAFVDVRMPPGIDGVQTARRLLSLDPDLQIVLCTAYSDYNHSELNRTLGLTDRVFLLRKPFDPIEVQQLALGLARKREALWRERHIRVQLEHEVDARTVALSQTNLALQQACAEAEASRERLQEFMSRMSHELLTPLNAILGYTDMLREDPEIPPIQHEMILDAHRGALRLSSLVQRSLLFQSLERYCPPRHSIRKPVRPWVERACADASELARSKGITWELQIEPEDACCVCDNTVLGEVIAALADNAAKFTRKGVIRVRVMLCDNQFVADVWDTGEGIPRELHRSVFEPFRQGDGSTSRRHEGAGIGLALVARAMKALGGSVDLESTPGEGTRVGIMVPL